MAKQKSECQSITRKENPVTIDRDWQFWSEHECWWDWQFWWDHECWWDWKCGGHRKKELTSRPLNPSLAQATRHVRGSSFELSASSVSLLGSASWMLVVFTYCLVTLIFLVCMRRLISPDPIMLVETLLPSSLSCPSSTFPSTSHFFSSCLKLLVCMESKSSFIWPSITLSFNSSVPSLEGAKPSFSIRARKKIAWIDVVCFSCSLFSCCLSCTQAIQSPASSLSRLWKKMREHVLTLIASVVISPTCMPCCKFCLLYLGTKEEKLSADITLSCTIATACLKYHLLCKCWRNVCRKSACLQESIHLLSAPAACMQDFLSAFSFRAFKNKHLTSTFFCLSSCCCCVHSKLQYSSIVLYHGIEEEIACIGVICFSPYCCCVHAMSSVLLFLSRLCTRDCLRLRSLFLPLLLLHALTIVSPFFQSSKKLLSTSFTSPPVIASRRF